MRKPLEDIRVVDMTHVWFGPWCTMMLADMGAEVIRVEPPWGAIDRISEGMLYGGAPYTFHHLNQNKKDLTLNLKSPEGMRLLKELIKKSDIVVQNMSVGTMEKLGLGYEDLKKLNPGIIYAALSGFGQYGPLQEQELLRRLRGGDERPHRMTGDGVDPQGPPIEMAMALGDTLPGSLAAMAILGSPPLPRQDRPRPDDRRRPARLHGRRQPGHHRLLPQRVDQLGDEEEVPYRRHRRHIQGEGRRLGPRRRLQPQRAGEPEELPQSRGADEGGLREVHRLEEQGRGGRGARRRRPPLLTHLPD